MSSAAPPLSDRGAANGKAESVGLGCQWPGKCGDRLGSSLFGPSIRRVPNSSTSWAREPQRGSERAGSGCQVGVDHQHPQRREAGAGAGPQGAAAAARHKHQRDRRRRRRRHCQPSMAGGVRRTCRCCRRTVPLSPSLDPKAQALCRAVSPVAWSGAFGSMATRPSRLATGSAARSICWQSHLHCALSKQLAAREAGEAVQQCAGIADGWPRPSCRSSLLISSSLPCSAAVCSRGSSIPPPPPAPPLRQPRDPLLY